MRNGSLFVLQNDDDGDEHHLSNKMRNSERQLEEGTCKMEVNMKNVIICVLENEMRKKERERERVRMFHFPVGFTTSNGIVLKLKACIHWATTSTLISVSNVAYTMSTGSKHAKELINACGQKFSLFRTPKYEGKV